MSSEQRPTKKQRELLGFIEGFIAAHGYGPSYREIMNGVGYRSVSTVATHVDNLIKKGHLRKRDYSARSLEVVQALKEFSEAPAKVTKSQEKWLIDQVSHRFNEFEKNPMPSELDNLYVLVGALQVLGFGEAAVALKSRLMEMTK